MLEGAFGGWPALLETLVRATPLILTSIAIVVSFRARIWNIGADGQLYAGAIAAYAAYRVLDGGPAPVLFLGVLAAGAAGGAALGGLAGFLRARFEVNEVLSTVMLNYIVHYLLAFLLLETGWRDSAGFYQQTPKVDVAARWPLLVPDSRLHVGFAIALVVAVAVHVLMKHSVLGYRIRAVGLNARAARAKGIAPGRMAVVVMLIGGAISGIAGSAQAFGLHHRLYPELSAGAGFEGIIVAMIAGLHPLACVPVAILFAAYETGGYQMEVATGVSAAIVATMQAVTLVCLLAGTVLSRYRLVGGRES
jgi:ABC-type uncharacterized transport system permease subunit